MFDWPALPRASQDPVPFLDMELLITGPLSKVLYFLGSHWSRPARFGALLPHADRILIGLPHDLTVNYASLDGPVNAVPPSSIQHPGLVMGATVAGHLMKVYDGTVLCARDTLMIDCAVMDGMNFYYSRREVRRTEDSLGACQATTGCLACLGGQVIGPSRSAKMLCCCLAQPVSAGFGSLWQDNLASTWTSVKFAMLAKRPAEPITLTWTRASDHELHVECTPRRWMMDAYQGMHACRLRVLIFCDG